MATVKRAKMKKKKFVQELKNKPCADCGMKYPYYVMDFDHVRGQKEFAISDATERCVSYKRLLKEAKKCDVVCANCHRVRTHKRLSS